MRRLLLLATTNPGKLAELRALFLDTGAPLTDLSEINLTLSVPEDGPDYRAIAAAKATAYASAAQLWTLADDTGLEVDALGGEPGVRSARLAGDDDARRRALLARLGPLPRPWTAHFRCAIALASPGGKTAIGFGSCEGEIIPEARGGHGFGYDPIFLVAGTGRTMAELYLAEKNELSHRARAAADLKRILRQTPWPDSPLPV